MNSKLYQLKQELKQLAIEIRKGKLECKSIQRENNGGGTWGWRGDARTYRHMHIAYCLLRGRTMKQIESKNREHNEPNSTLVKQYMEMYHEEVIHSDKV